VFKSDQNINLAKKDCCTVMILLCVSWPKTVQKGRADRRIEGLDRSYLNEIGTRKSGSSERTARMTMVNWGYK
jgi:hypothetical protein